VCADHRGVREGRPRRRWGTGPAWDIHQVAVSGQSDLIALASHGRGGLSRLLFGSVAAGLVQRATTPLLIVGPTRIGSSERST
jgi:nucleotide-binding universal stress UspA family protein